MEKQQHARVSQNLVVQGTALHGESHTTAATDDIPLLRSNALESENRAIHQPPALQCDTVCVHNFINVDDNIDDEDEREEILNDLRTLIMVFGEVARLHIIQRSIVCPSTSAMTEEKLVYVTFTEISSAVKCFEALEGMIVGGMALHTEFQSCDSKDSASQIELNQHTNESVDLSPTKQFPPLDVISSSVDASISIKPIRAVLQLEDVIFREDVQDEDETQEVLSNLQALCEVYGQISCIWLQHIQNGKGNNNTSSSSTGDDAHNLPLVRIRLTSFQAALTVANTLHNLTVAGSQLVSYLDSRQIQMYARHSRQQHTKEQDSEVSKITQKHNELGTDDIHYDNLNRDIDLFISGYVCSDDLETLSVDEMIEMKQDLLHLIDSHHPSDDNPNTVLPVSMEILASHTAVQSLVLSTDAHSEFYRYLNSSQLTETDNYIQDLDQDNQYDDKGIMGCVGFVEAKQAVQAMLHLHGTVLGGAVIRASVQYLNESSVHANKSSSNRDEHSNTEAIVGQQTCTATGMISHNNPLNAAEDSAKMTSNICESNGNEILVSNASEGIIQSFVFIYNAIL